MKILTKQCLGCGQTINKPYTESMKDWLGRHKFCTKLCANTFWKGKHKNPKGEFGQREYTPWLKGTKGLIKGNSGSFKKGHVGPYHGKKFPQVTGPLNNHWKGGVTKLQEKIRKSLEYKFWRKQIFERDNYTCQNCGQRGGNKHADHYPTSFAQLLKDHNIATLEQAIACPQLWDINNGRTLCIPCHKETETYLHKLSASLGS